MVDPARAEVEGVVEGTTHECTDGEEDEEVEGEIGQNGHDESIEVARRSAQVRGRTTTTANKIDQPTPTDDDDVPNVSQTYQSLQIHQTRPRNGETTTRTLSTLS